MSKAVLLSIRPDGVIKIASGDKTVDVRKTRPQIDLPFKCYIYCTQPNSYNPCVPLHYRRQNSTVYDSFFTARVIGEFVCDKIFDCDADSVGLFDKATKAYISGSCLGFSEICTYAKGVLPLYGWHISNLVIYDKPKDLDDFYRFRKCDACESGYESSACIYDDKCIVPAQLERPPQSWCYVEELE